MNVNLKSLIGRLNDVTRVALDGAAALCLSLNHYDIELEHFLMKLLESQDSDFAKIFNQFGVNKSNLQRDLEKSLTSFKKGSSSRPNISTRIVDLLTSAWTFGSLDLGGSRIRSGYVMVALLGDERLGRYAREISKELNKVPPEALRKDFFNICAGTSEDVSSSEVSGAGGEPGPGAKPGSKTPNIDQFTVNLTERAKAGKIDPVLGRDAEIRQVVDILMRRRQNNPIMTGEAGVGKTAVVEGFAIRVANGDVPPPLKNVTIRTLDLALLQAGASVKGEFENRLKGLIEEVKSSPTPIMV